MLSREVCKACFDRHNPSGSRWRNLSLEAWQRFSHVICPWVRVNCQRFVAFDSDHPPEWCPYLTEHIIAMGKNVE